MNAGRMADDHRVVGHVAGHHRPHPDHCEAANGKPRANAGSGTNGRTGAH